MYGENRYGIQKYAADKSDTQIRDEYFVNLMNLVPEYLAGFREMRELYNAQGCEIGNLKHALENMVDQCFILTATWGLARWEKVFDIPTNLSPTYEQRREILTAKTRGQGTTTKGMIKEAAAAFSGGDVEVIEHNAEGFFTVRFIGIKGIPRNMQGFINMLKDIKPAHLAYRFEYRYTVWNEIKENSWNDQPGMSWDEIRMLKEE